MAYTRVHIPPLLFQASLVQDKRTRERPPLKYEELRICGDISTESHTPLLNCKLPTDELSRSAESLFALPSLVQLSRATRKLVAAASRTSNIGAK